MEKNFKVTYIVPVHEYNDEVEKYLTRALKSLTVQDSAEDYEVFFVGKLDILTKCQEVAKKVDVPQIVTLVPTDEEDIFEKINIAASKCHTDYFSVLEFDDAFYPYWNKVAQSYLSEKEYSVLLPMNENTRTDGTVPTLGNEIAWDAAFVNDLGHITKDELLVYKDFNVTGAYIKTKDFIDFGKLKSKLKIAAWYEFLLNVVDNGGTIFVAPRIGYIHTVLREGSYMVKCQSELTTEEAITLINEATKAHKPKEEKKEE